MIRRGGCNFSVKADNAAAAGAVGAIIANNAAGPLTNVTLGDPGRRSRSAASSQADGTTLIAAAGQTATLELVYEDVDPHPAQRHRRRPAPAAPTTS